MIQRSYLIWYKHKSYFHAHWQLFLLQIHPYSIVWCILQMALFLFCQIISYVVKTNLWYQGLVKTSRPQLEISKFVHFAENFKKLSSPLWSWIFSNSAIFPIFFSCFFDQLDKVYKSRVKTWWRQSRQLIETKVENWKDNKVV